MRRVLLVAAIAVLSGCGGSGSSPPPSVDVTGIWSGPGTDSEFGDATLTLNLSQTTGSADVSGSYSILYDGDTISGALEGTVSAADLAFTIHVSQAGCTGTFAGTGSVDSVSGAMTVTYSGTTSGASYCGQESGSATLYPTS